MKPVDHATFAVIVNDQLQFDVWSMRRKLLPGWIYAGPTGTREEMQTLLRLQAPPPRQRKVARTTARD